MKKRTGIFVMLLFLLLGSVRIGADVIWEPEDPFFSAHSEECVYVDRFYTANGPDQVVMVYKNPESAAIVNRLENGTEVHISHTYTDKNGIAWGFADNEGWLPMDYMELVYDSISFAESYADEIEEKKGRLDSQYTNEQIALWEYPGSEAVDLVCPGDFENNLPEYSAVFVDEQNRTWGNTAYYYGYRDKWICLEQPTATFTELYPDGAPKRSAPSLPIDPVNRDERIVPASNYRTTAILCAAVGLLVLVTAVFLLKWKKKTEN